MRDGRTRYDPCTRPRGGGSAGQRAGTVTVRCLSTCRWHVEAWERRGTAEDVGRRADAAPRRVPGSCNGVIAEQRDGRVSAESQRSAHMLVWQRIRLLRRRCMSGPRVSLQRRGRSGAVQDVVCAGCCCSLVGCVALRTRHRAQHG